MKSGLIPYDTILDWAKLIVCIPVIRVLTVALLFNRRFRKDLLRCS